MAGLELKNVVKRFGEVTVVQQLDLVVHEGEFVVLLGESGCGKSTTLRMVAGLEEVTEGQVLIGGKDVTNVHPMARDIAMVFQNYALYPHMDVAQHMSVALRLAGRPAAEIAAKVATAAKVLNIEHLLQRKPKELSGGQRQRVAIGRAIVREPKVFLFDEPLSNLDAKLRGHMRAELALLHERLGKTTLYVTHDQVEAMTLADRIVIFDKGCIQQVGTPAEVFQRPATLFVAGFIGTPTMNLFDARLVREGGRDLLRGHGFAMPAPQWLRDAATPGPALTVGIRPQMFRPVSVGAPAGAPAGAGAGAGAGEDANGAALTLHVDVVEYLGTESQVVGHLLAPGAADPGQRVSATVPGDAKALLHSALALSVDPGQLHIFDSASGCALRP